MGSAWVWKAEKAAVPLGQLCRTYVRAPPGDWHISVRDGEYYCFFPVIPEENSGKPQTPMSPFLLHRHVLPFTSVHVILGESMTPHAAE